MKFLSMAGLAVLCGLLPLSAAAQAYKCKDANGSISYQQTPCASGEQRILRVESSTSSTAGAASVISATAPKTESGTTDKRIPLNRTASKTTVDSCIRFHQPALLESGDNFRISSQMVQRMWLSAVGPAQRNMVTITIAEKGRVGAEQMTFSCILSGDDSTDVRATRAMQAE